MQNKGDLIVKETGIWFLNDDKSQSWLGPSPDGIIEESGQIKTVLEIKCPFKGGQTVPYRNVCINHISKPRQKCSVHPLSNVTMLFGLLLALKFS